MSWLLLVLSAVFIATAAADETFSQFSCRKDFNGGVIEVHSLVDGFLCRGILLTSTKALAVGDCVFFYSQKPHSLFLRIFNPDLQPGHFSTSVLVDKVDLHPEYLTGKQIFNLAVLSSHPSPYPKLVTFKVPEIPYPPEEIIEKTISGFVTFYQPFPKNVNASVTLDYTVCGEDNMTEDKYCVLTQSRVVYFKKDSGTPFFLQPNQTMEAVGFYMGQNLGQFKEGFIFIRLYKASKWINDNLKK